MIYLPIADGYNDVPSTTVTNEMQTLEQTIDPGDKPTAEESHTNGLIADLAWILLLGALVTLLFKKLKQPVVLGYILAGFLASPKFEYLPSISNLDNITPDHRR